MYMNASSESRGLNSHDLFDHELVALRALRDPLPSVRGPVAGRPGRLRGLDERLRPGRIQGEGLQPDEVVQLVHDLRREDRLELGEELGLRRPEVPPARDEQQDALAEQAAAAARPAFRQDRVDAQGDDRRERVFDALPGPRAGHEHGRRRELLPEPGRLLGSDRHGVRAVDLVERDADRYRTGDLRHDLHPILDQVEGVRPLDVADGEDARGAGKGYIPTSNSDPKFLLETVPDRPGHVQRHAVDSAKIRSKLHWKPPQWFADELTETVRWFREHESWWKPIKSASFKKYDEVQYRGLRETTPSYSLAPNPR